MRGRSTPSTTRIIDLDLFDKATFAALVDEVRTLLKTDA
jgi:hypothetical protein